MTMKMMMIMMKMVMVMVMMTMTMTMVMMMMMMVTITMVMMMMMLQPGCITPVQCTERIYLSPSPQPSTVLPLVFSSSSFLYHTHHHHHYNPHPHYNNCHHNVSILLYPVSLLRWSTQRANGQYKDHLVGRLTTIMYKLVCLKSFSTRLLTKVL